MYDAVKNHLDNIGWRYDVKREGSLIKAGVQGRSGSYQVIFDVKQDRDTFIVYVMSRLDFPATNRDNIALYLTRCNYGLTIGNFELDMSDGEVRYKTSVTVKGGMLSEEMIKEMVQISIVMMDKFFEGIVKVAYVGLDPKVAYEESRSASRSSRNDSTSVDRNSISPAQ